MNMDRTKVKLRKCDQKFLQERLGKSISHLMTFLDSKNTDCTVPAEAREQASVYLSSWVVGPLEDLMLWAHGEPVPSRHMTDTEFQRRRDKLKEILKC